MCVCAGRVAGELGGGGAQTIIPEAFRILESISGKGGGKGAQPLWVKGFRSCFNLLADIRTVGQKSWSGIWTRIRLLNDWHFTDWHWETEEWESTCRPDLYLQTLCVCVCVCVYLPFCKGVMSGLSMHSSVQWFLFVCFGVCECTHTRAWMHTHTRACGYVRVSHCTWECIAPSCINTYLRLRGC